MKKLLFLLTLLLTLSISAQTNLDSLKKTWNNESLHDTIRLHAIDDFNWEFYLFSQPDSAFYFAQLQLEFAQKTNNKKWQVGAFNTQGIATYIMGDYAQALAYYESGLAIQTELGNKKGEAATLGNIGIIYKEQGDNVRALSYYKRSLAIKEEVGDENGIAATLNNIGIVYKDQGKINKALEYYLKSLALEEKIVQPNGKIGNPKGIAISLSNIGSVYQDKGDYDNALKYHQRSLDIYTKIGDQHGLTVALDNFGTIYKLEGKNEKALSYFTQSLAIREEMKDKRGTGISLTNIGIAYFNMENISLAIEYGQRSLKIAQELGSPLRIAGASELLTKAYKKENNFKSSLEMYELQVAMRDSLNSDEVKKEIAHAESKAEFEKAILVKEQEEKEVARATAENTIRKNNIQYTGIGFGLFLIFILVFFVGKFSPPKWVLELSVFLPFLILFEFLLVLTDPYLETLTSGEPVLKLLINASMAGLIFPLHSFFEKLLKRKVFKSNE